LLQESYKIYTLPGQNIQHSVQTVAALLAMANNGCDNRLPHSHNSLLLDTSISKFNPNHTRVPNKMQLRQT